MRLVSGSIDAGSGASAIRSKEPNYQTHSGGLQQQDEGSLTRENERSLPSKHQANLNSQLTSISKRSEGQFKKFASRQQSSDNKDLLEGFEDGFELNQQSKTSHISYVKQ